jgi:4-hydroxy 2-oxovalerate aldolase
MLIEELYDEYQDKYCDDRFVVDLLKKELFGKKVLLLGPGKTLQENADIINDFIHENSPTVVSINFLNEGFPINYVFMGNAKRYSQFFHKIHGEKPVVKLICTSNITEAGKKIDYIVNYSSLFSTIEVIRDNPFIMFLNLLKKINIKEIWLAGFDGYVQDNADNYYGDYVRFLYCQDDNVIARNDAIKNELSGLSSNMKIKSLTPTRYL